MNTPRTSLLAGQKIHAYHPQDNPINTSDTGEAGEAGVASNPGNAGSASTRGGARPTSSGGGRSKFTISIDANVLGRLRAAYRIDGAATGVSFSGWAAAILTARLEDIETQNNNGRPLNPIGPGHIPTGPAI